MTEKMLKFRVRAIKILLDLAIVLTIVTGAVIIFPAYRRSVALREANRELEEKIVAKKAAIAKLEENQRRFRTDADFVEIIARQNHRVLPGELIFRFDK